MYAQIGWKAEGTVGTAETVDRFIELPSETLQAARVRMVSSNRRPGQRAPRHDRIARAAFSGLTGDINFQPLSKGFGGILEQACGSIATSGPSESTVYVHTASPGDLTGVASTIQVGRHMSDGNVQAFTYAGCKTAGISFRSALDGILECAWSIAHALSESTSTSLATASYPSEAEVFSFVGGTLTLDAGAVSVRDMSCQLRNALALRRFQGQPAGKEPLENGDREVTAAFTAEFESMTLVNKLKSPTAAGAQGALVMAWEAPTVIGGGGSPTLKSKLTITIPVLDFISGEPNASGPDIITLSCSGQALTNASGVIATIAYQTLDSTP